jgi:hypothetical protein
MTQTREIRPEVGQRTKIFGLFAPIFLARHRWRLLTFTQYADRSAASSYISSQPV